MKQFFITMLMAIAFALGMNAQETSLTHVQTVPSNSTYHALDKEGNLHLATYTRNGDNTITFYIYNKDLSIAHSFTSKQTFIGEYVLYLFDGLKIVDGEVILSQTLFNNDDEWEFGIEKDFGGYTIYNESGAMISLPKVEGYPSNYVAKGPTQYIGYSCSSSNDSYYVYYSAQGTNSARAQELNENKISVVPNPVRSGQAFTVSFTNAMTDTCIFSILDLNGVSIYSSDIQAGETAKTVPGNTLSPGMYLYTVSSVDGLVQSGKIIVQ